MDNVVIDNLKVIWDYMVLNMEIKKADLIIGCGCKSLEIPKKCVELYNEGYASNILFTGGYGKITVNEFKRTEAEIYKKIAIDLGVDKNRVFIENRSTNTGDNFKFSVDVVKNNNLRANKIIIVHNKFSQRRTLNTAKIYFRNSELMVTSPDKTFEDFIKSMKNRKMEDVKNIISVIVGDVQRIVIFPKLGWQVEDKVPKEVVDSYYFLKQKGYYNYIFSKDKIQKLFDKYGLKNKKCSYFN